MSEIPHWPLLATDHVADCKVFTVSRTTAQSPRTGRSHPFFRIDSTDWVNIVALTDDDEVVMVRQFRHGPREVTLEIPGGMVDDGEDPADAALRELREESGYAAPSARRIGVVNPNPALFGNRAWTYLAKGAQRVGEIDNDGTEHTEVELVPRAQIPERLADGAIDHALVVAAFLWHSLLPAAERGAG